MEVRMTVEGRAPKALILLAAALVLAVASLGCGDAGGAGDEEAGAATPESRAAKELVAKYAGPVKFESPGGAIDMSSLRGKEVWMISADLSIPFHQNIVRGFEQGAREAGLRPVRFDGKGQTKEAARGIQQAIGAGAGAIGLISIDPSFVKEAVRQANEAQIPVVGVLTTDAHAKPLPGTSGEVTNDYVLMGNLLSAYAVANTDGPVRALHSDTSEFRLLGFLKTGLYEGMRRYCGDSCSLETFDTQIANFKTQLPTLVQSQLRRNPDTNWMFPAFDAQAVFVVPAIKQAGMGEQVTVGSINAVKANLDMIKASDTQVVDLGNPNAWLGWATVDRMARAMLGKRPAVSVVPIRLFDRTNLAKLDTGDESELYAGADYQAEYRRLWRLAAR